MLDHILNWKLLKGSHRFPGADGGTCVNEAAVVAAGFKYRKIDNADDCPPCFSRPIAAYALSLNDHMPDDLRQELLLPFVMRLAGTADSAAKERERIIYIAVQTVKRILPIALHYAGMWEQADRCEQANTLAEAKVAANSADSASADRAARASGVFSVLTSTSNAAASAYIATKLAASAYTTADVAAHAACAASVAAHAAHAAHAANVAAVRAANVAAHAARAAEASYYEGDAARNQVFAAAVSILDEAIKLGRQGDPLDAQLVATRLERAKEVVPCA